MLNHLSWTTYIEVIIALLALYYLFILVRFFGADLRRAFNGGESDNRKLQGIPDALRYQAVQDEPATRQADAKIATDNYRDDSLEEADRLIGEVKLCIHAASGKPFAPAILIPQLKKIFQNNPELHDSPHRPAINELVVSECERLGTALLTEDEVDLWWKD